MVNQNTINVGKLIRTLLHFAWQRECEIIPAYQPKQDDPPRCVVRFRDQYLRHSKGPRQGCMWDCYGDDFLEPELALFELSRAPAPPIAEGLLYPLHWPD